MVEHHWGLSHAPFGEGSGPFVPVPSQVEAVARLVHLIESRERRVTLEAPEGLGKSVVLREALARARRPGRKIVPVIASGDEASLVADVARGLGATQARWRELARAAHACALQGQALVLAVDQVGHPDEEAVLDRLDHLAARLTLVRVRRPYETGATAPRAWDLAIRLVPLTRRETEVYLAAKLAAAGRRSETFTPSAVTRLHALTQGTPRGVDRLAGLALRAGAALALDRITPEVIVGVAGECVLPDAA